MTQLPDNDPQTPVTLSAAMLEAALNAAFAPAVSERIKRSLIAAMQVVVNEADDE